MLAVDVPAHQHPDNAVWLSFRQQVRKCISIGDEVVAVPIVVSFLAWHLCLLAVMCRVE